MADICAVNLLPIDPNCEAFKKRGGANKRLWRGTIEDVSAITYNADGGIVTLILKSGKKLYAYKGRDYSNTASMGFARSENGVIDYTHSVTFMASEISQADMNAIEAAAEAEGTFAIVQTNSGQLKVYGLNKGANWPSSSGLRVNTIDSSIGTASGDSSAVTLLMEGMADGGAIYFDGAPASTLAENIAILDGMLEAAP